MASKEELQALGIELKQCKECCKDISVAEYKKYSGYCKSCFSDKENIESRKTSYNSQDEQENYYDDKETNKVAKIIKIIAIIGAVAGIMLGLTLVEDLEGLSIGIMVVSIILAVFVYALGEIIQKLQNIEDNTKNNGGINNGTN